MGQPRLECDKKDCWWRGMAICATCIHNYYRAKTHRSRNAFSSIDDRIKKRINQQQLYDES